MAGLEAVLSVFPRERTWLLPALQAIQHAQRHLSAAALEATAAYLRVPTSEVWGVATHYPEFRLTPPGRKLVRVCAGVACDTRGGQALLAATEEQLGVRAGETTADGAVTLETMDCGFVCSMAPVMEVEGRYRGWVKVIELEDILDDHADVPDIPRGGAPPPISPMTGSPAARFGALKREAERRRTGARIAVGMGTCGLAVGAADTFSMLEIEVARKRLPFTVVAAGCNGMCWAAPVVEVLRDGRPRLISGPITVDLVPSLLSALSASVATADIETGADFLAPQQRILMERCGMANPYDIADALRHGSYMTVARVLEDARPDHIIEEVAASGLAGRGGAYFPTATKWRACREAKGHPKYLIVNGEEGEPGIFKDRHLMEGDPHRLLEGMLLAAYAAGASHGILYIHGEANVAAERLVVAVEQARAWGLLGEAILGSDFRFDVEVRRGAGGFVLGEETALLESIEGRRAMPRTRPPFPAEAGLFGRPTVINNVETLFAVVSIVQRGGAWYAGFGGGRGTKVFGLSGHVQRPGVVEMELGTTLRTLLETLGGGSSTRQPLDAAVVGGPSGSVVPARLFDEPLVPRGRVNPGTGGVVALDADYPVREAVRLLLDFNARESCGKCTPCREGTARLLAMLDQPLHGPRVRELAEVIQVASLCGLGQAAPLSVLSGIAEFPTAFGVSSDAS